MSDRADNNPPVRVQRPVTQAVVVQVLNVFFSAIQYGLHKSVLRNNSMDEEFLFSLLLW